MYSNYNLWDPWVPDELLPQGSNLHSETDADSCSTEHRPAGCRIKSFLETRETGPACCKDVYWTPAHTDTELMSSASSYGAWTHPDTHTCKLLAPWALASVSAAATQARLTLSSEAAEDPRPELQIYSAMGATGTTRLKTSNYSLTVSASINSQHLTEDLGDTFATVRTEHTHRTLSATDHRHGASVSECKQAGHTSWVVWEAQGPKLFLSCTGLWVGAQTATVCERSSANSSFGF